TEYTEALHRLNLSSDNETKDYYASMMVGSPSCFLQGLRQVALHNVMQNLQAKALTRARRTRSLHDDNAHCLHRHFGMGPGVGDHCENIEEPLARVRRSDPPRPTPPRVRRPRPGGVDTPQRPLPKPRPGGGSTPPIPPTKPKSLVEKVSESLGMKPVIGPGVQEVQLGAHGSDGSVVGSDGLTTSLREQLRKAVEQRAPTLPTDMNPDDLEKARIRWR
ncbi:hypothetical protein DDJ38_30435, partial [Klebsiella pneumoniae]